MTNLQTKFPSDTWVAASWDDYLQGIEDPVYETARGYYYDGRLRIEMSPVGPDHSRDSTVISLVVNLFCTIKGIPANGLINCSYRKTGVRECQPDISYYIGENAQLAPEGISPVDLDCNPAPDLAIEIASTSLADDLGSKRLLYEQMGIAEYWVVDVQNAQAIIFAIANRGSRQITQSQVLPGLTMTLLKKALQRSRQVNQAELGRWLLTQIQALE